MQFLIDVSDGNLNRLGDGPIASATRWRSTTRMDRSGDFSCTIPASDPKAALIARKRILTCYAIIGGVRTALGGGIIDSIDTRPGADGNVLLEISGADLLRELAYRSVGLLEISNGAGAGVTHAAAVASLASYAPAGWTFIAATSPAHNAIYARFAGESVLAACVRVAAASGCHFYLSDEREVTFVASYSASGVRAIAPQAGADLADSATCYIADLSRTEDSYDLITRIYPLGAGQGRARLTLAATTKSAPTGYTLNKSANYLEHNANAVTYGRIERWVEFKDIAPISNTSADVRAASDALFNASLDYIQRRIVPAEFYRLRVAQCGQRLYPLQTIRTIYKNVVDGRTILNLDENLIILETTTEISQDGLRTTDLTVATTDRWPDSDASAVINNVAQGAVFQAHPQLNANSYVTGYTKSLDGSQNAFFRFRLGDEVTQLQQALFEFQILPLESTVKSVGTTTTSTASGGGSTVTSASGGATTQTTTSGGGTTVTSASGGATTQTTTSGGGTTVTSASAPAVTSTSTSGGGATVTSAAGGNVTVTSLAGGATTQTTTSGGGSTVTSTTQAQNTLASASAPASTVTSTSGGGTTQTTTSGGGVTVSSAAGGGTTQSTVSGGGGNPTSAAGGSISVTSGSVPTVTPTSGAGGGTTRTTTTQQQIAPISQPNIIEITSSHSSPVQSSTSRHDGAIDVTSADGGRRTITSQSGSGHSHEINLGNSTFGNTVYYAGIGGAGDLRTAGGGRLYTSSTGSGHTHAIDLPDHTHQVRANPHQHLFDLPSHEHRITLPSHTHVVTIPQHNHEFTLENHAHSFTIPSHTHSVDLPNHTHTVNVPAHTHGITLADHQHNVTVPAHSHAVTIPAHSHDVTLPSHSHTVTIPAHNHDVTVPAHSHAVTIPTHSHDVTVPSHTHTVNVPAHSHDVTVPSHSHSVTIPAHSHAVTIPSHSHDVSIPAHSHSVTIPSHSHDVNIPAHTHNFTPVINTEYGIFRNATSGTFGISDLEYRVNSGSWANLNAATSVGSSWYQLDLTAALQDSATLRPLQESNIIEIRGKTAKTATIDALLSIRNIIQAIAYL